MGRAKNRKEAAEQFWIDVENQLVQPPFGHSHREAKRGIDLYRSQIAPKLSEVVYNQGEELVAKAIHALIANQHQLPTIAS